MSRPRVNRLLCVVCTTMGCLVRPSDMVSLSMGPFLAPSESWATQRGSTGYSSESDSSVIAIVANTGSTVIVTSSPFSNGPPLSST